MHTMDQQQAFSIRSTWCTLQQAVKHLRDPLVTHIQGFPLAPAECFQGIEQPSDGYRLGRMNAPDFYEGMPESCAFSEIQVKQPALVAAVTTLPA